MNVTKEELQRAHRTALEMLPGFKQAQAQLAVATHVIEYFARYPELEISPGVYQEFPLAEAKLLEEISQLKAMLSAFGGLQEGKT
jgi:hypothetical protein